MDVTYDIALNYFHTPLIYYAPGIFKQSRTYKNIGGQIDVFPTTMGLLKLPYVNNTLGIDLINETRNYTIINDDDKIGILDTSYFCILKSDEDNIQLYKYRDRDLTNYFEQNEAKANEMIEYAKSNIQVYQSMILNRETSLSNQLDVE
jgi:phosphoglycerol transferase MdoB-like AlkP superfamily enzyme